jgi:hypothetical protein
VTAVRAYLNVTHSDILQIGLRKVMEILRRFGLAKAFDASII